jgi:cytidylate kinase
MTAASELGGGAPPEERALTIAIDGPGGSGKSTLGAALAGRLGYTYFDSGAVYRALTWLALHRNVDPSDEGALARLARRMALQVTRPTVEDGRQYTVLVDGHDVTWAIRSPEVDQHVSAVSAHPAVREALTQRLRQFAARDGRGSGGLVMVGRDIGTVVLPGADLKLYLTAAVEERARRRCAELRARGQPAEYDAILADLRRRDAIDSARAAAPLRPAGDALHLDSDRLTVDDEVEFVLRQLARPATRTSPARNPALRAQRGSVERQPDHTQAPVGPSDPLAASDERPR